MEKSLKLQNTGVSSFDEMLNGGVPFGSSVVLFGAPGTGKTLFAQQWLFRGIQEYGEPGLYLSFTESNRKSLQNLSNFSFFDEADVEPGRVNFADFRIIFNQLKISSYQELTAETLDRVIDVVRHMVDATGAKRVVFDSLTALLSMLPDESQRREFIFRLGNSLANMGATIFLIVEAQSRRDVTVGVEEYIADGIFEFTNDMGQQSMVRRLNVLKLRGSSFRSGQVIFDILEDGIQIYPKIPNYSLTAKTDFNDRLSLGIDKFDDLIGGGIPRGHIMLMGGNTGTGKTTVISHFINEGMKHDEPAVYVALEESVTQIVKTAEQHGWDFTKAQDDEKLQFVTTELIDLYPDRLLYNIIEAVERIGAKRVVIDSISSMENAAFDSTRIREFLLQILAYFKSEGVTCIMTYLTPEMFSSGETQLLGNTTSTELGLSSMVDGIVLLRYVEREQSVKRLMSILKLRGSAHDKNIFEYEISKNGMAIKGQFKE